MTNDTIDHLLDALNARALKDRIFLASISQAVEYARVWLKEPEGRAVNEGSCGFFFIKNESGLYVAAVLDMGSDLHAFVKEPHRKKGYLATAMKTTILPYLFQKGRQKQRITFNDPDMAVYSNKHLGFCVTSDTTAELDLVAFESTPAIHAQRSVLSKDDFAAIKIKINRARLYLTMVKEQLDIAYGDSSETDLECLIHELDGLDDGLLSYIEDRQGRLPD